MQANNNDLKKVILDNLNTDFVISTIIETHGSSPRKSGATMITKKDELLSGTVGGGKIEHEAFLFAHQKIDSKNSEIEIQKYVLADNTAHSIGMVCGGEAKIIFIPNHQKYGFEREIIERSIGFIVNKNNEFRFINNEDEVDKDDIFVSFLPRARAYVFGGGHVAQKTVPLLNYIGLHTIVLENREKFLTKELFPTADELRLVDYQNLNDLDIKNNDLAIVLTRGHESDTDVILSAIKYSPSYLGVIGSKRKRKILDEILKKNNIDERIIASIKSPIGLDINAETPEEIAVSIVGEIIKHLNE